MINFIVLDQLKDDFNAFLKANALWMAIVLVVVLGMIPLIILLINKLRKKEDKPVIAEKSLWIEALGGSENIVSSEAYGSRLAISVVDKAKVNKESLKGLGVTSFVEMSNKITLVLEDKAELVKKEIDK